MAHTKVDPALVRVIRRRYKEGISQGTLAREYVMSVAQIGKIIRREAWVDVSDEEPVEQPTDAAASLAKLQRMLGDEVRISRSLEDLKK